MLPYAVTALVTKVSALVPADSFMPNLDEDDCWELEEKSEAVSENGVEFRFCTYKRVCGE